MTTDLPADPESRARHEAWNAALAAAQAAEAQPQAPEVKPDIRALAIIDATQAGRDPKTGKRYYDDNQKFREVVERLRVEVFEGKFDLERAKREVADALGKEYKPPKAEEPAEPQGTLAERADPYPDLAHIEIGGERFEFDKESPLYQSMTAKAAALGLSADQFAELAAEFARNLES